MKQPQSGAGVGWFGSRAIGSLGLLASSLLVAAVLGETAARMLTPAPMPLPAPQVSYIPDPLLAFALRPSQTAFTYSEVAHIDAHGFRLNGSDQATTDSAAVVLALGDSFTFGLGVADNATWPAQLEQRLRPRARRGLRVVNTGTVSYGATQELDLLRDRGLVLRPKVILHALYWNDRGSVRPPAAGAPPVVTPGGEFAWDAEPTGGTALQAAGRKALRTSRLLSVVWRLLNNRHVPYAQAYDSLMHGQLVEGDWEPVRAFYRGLRHIADSTGAAVYAIIMPVSGLVDRIDPAAHAYPALARRLLEENRIPFIDGFEVLRTTGAARTAFLPQGPDSHLTSLGYRLIADALATAMLRDSAIAQRLLLAPDGREGGRVVTVAGPDGTPGDRHE